MTVDELMKLLEAVPYFTEIALAVGQGTSPPLCAEISGLAHLNPHHGSIYRPPEKLYLFSSERLRRLPGEIWIPAFRREPDS